MVDADAFTTMTGVDEGVEDGRYYFVNREVVNNENMTSTVSEHTEGLVDNAEE